MSTDKTLPLLFTLNGSSRHELILVSPSTPLSTLTSLVSNAAASSPNCEEFMSKYKKKSETPEQVAEVKVHWASVGRDAKIFPATTVVTEENCEAVLRMIEAGGVGRDVLEVKMAKAEEEK